MIGIKFDGLGHFSNCSVLYAKPFEKSTKKISILRDKLLKYFIKNGIAKYFHHQNDANFVYHLPLVLKKVLKLEMYKDIPFVETGNKLQWDLFM
ncbi:hypothetical protein A3Q56_01725 [Intoshia linei]|uniref:Uncharacterized protein n=1 Tax=Intoshia linei TaxID=1819745 RepID=A0A177BAQ3_9BILA|nr:hypothetical protein A3Q56_01725 [Intoshia linei]